MTSMPEDASKSSRKGKGRIAVPVESRFWPMVDRRSSDECWNWTGSGYGQGYGGFMVQRSGTHRCIGAHRVAYALTFGEPPDGVFILHRCDNRRCCNPAHLFLGDHDANMADMSAKGRSTARLRPEQAVAARALGQHAGWSVRRIADYFKVSRPVIKALLSGETYRQAPTLTAQELWRSERKGRFTRVA